MHEEQVMQQGDIVTSIVDLARYPLDRSDSDVYRQLLDSARQQLADVGCVRFSQFIRPG